MSILSVRLICEWTVASAFFLYFVNWHIIFYFSTGAETQVVSVERLTLCAGLWCLDLTAQSTAVSSKVWNHRPIHTINLGRAAVHAVLYVPEIKFVHVWIVLLCDISRCLVVFITSWLDSVPLRNSSVVLKDPVGMSFSALVRQSSQCWTN